MTTIATETPFHLQLDRIPPISDEDLSQLAAHIRPIIIRDGRRYYVDRRDLRRESFLWGAEPSEPAPHLSPVGVLLTYHEFGAPALFKPSVAEVLAQVKAQLSPEWLVRIAAFLVESDNLDAYHVLSDGYHFTKTHLFERLICRWDGEWTASGARMEAVVGRMTHDGPVYSRTPDKEDLS